MSAVAWPAEDITEDVLLGGRVRLRQPRTGYRAATDPVLLAAAISAHKGARVLDVGCGVGAAAMCLATRLDVDLYGIEAQAEYAALASENAPDMQVWVGDIFAPPPDLAHIGFDWVISNPPYFDAADPASPNEGRDVARREAQGAQAWTAACLRRVRSGGRIATIHLAERLPAILAGLSGAGDIAVLPLQARVGRPAKRVIVTARKGARGPFRLAAPLVLHQGDKHQGDFDDFTPEAQAVLRDAAPLIF